MIPKIIHQVWIGHKKPPQRMLDTCKEMNPSWEYRFWNEENLSKIEFVNQKQINNYPSYHGKCDIIRYELLYNFGGFYIDADSECIKSLDDSFLQNDSFACYESERVTGSLIANGYLAAIKGNELMKFLIDSISKMNITAHTVPWRDTGPQFLTNTIRAKKYSKIKIYPSHYFLPFHHTDIKGNLDSPHLKERIKQAYFKQYWGSTHGSIYESLK